MKKNIIKIPKIILSKAKNINSDDIATIFVKELSKEDIGNGLYTHLNIQYENKSFVIPNEIIPDFNQGKYSKWNVDGREIKREDLPKETFYVHIEAPNWNGYGTHGVSIKRERYPIDFLSPRNIKIKIDKISENEATFLLKFTISETLHKKDSDFEENLLFCLNLLQENLGGCDIEKSGTSISEYIKTNIMSWEIFPLGKRDDSLARIFASKSYSSKERETIGDRFDFFEKLNPKENIIGNSGFSKYFGAKLEHDIVVFENVEYGNAIYIMYKNWEELSKKSRLDLLSGRYGRDFDRIAHIGNWKSKVKRTILRYKKSNNLGSNKLQNYS